MNQQAKTIETPERDIRALAEALAEARQTLNDWIATQAWDVVYPEVVDAARERFRKRGGRINASATVTANITERLQEVGHE